MPKSERGLGARSDFPTPQQAVCPEHCEHSAAWMKNGACTAFVGESISSGVSRCGHRCFPAPSELAQLSGTLIVDQLGRYGNGKIIESELALVFDNLLDRLRSQATAETPLTVEAALKELRKMFPRMYCFIDGNQRGHVRYDNGAIRVATRVVIGIQLINEDLRFTGTDTSEAIQKVRDWKRDMDADSNNQMIAEFNDR